MFRVRCSNPKIIVNPSLIYQIRFVVNFHYWNFKYDIPAHRYVDRDEIMRVLCGENVLKVFQIYPPNEYSSDVEEQFQWASNFFFTSENGEVFDVFTQVKCGQCAVCRESYVSTIRQRVMFQLQQVPTMPWFVTLTVAPEHISKRGPDIRTIQLFKKKLKRVLERDFHYNGDLVKFVTVSENGHDKDGSDRYNLHYHMLVLGLPVFHENNYTNLLYTTHLFQYLWRFPEYEFDKNGKQSLNPISFSDYRKKYPIVFKRHKDYDPFQRGFVLCKMLDSVGKAVNYVTKYITKDVKNDESVHLLEEYDKLRHRSYMYRPKYDKRGWRPHFCICSANMGVDFVRQLPVRPDGKVAFNNWFDNTLYVVNLTSYYINKLFPSFSKLVPCDIRRAFDNCVVEISRLVQSKFCDRTLWKFLMNTSIYVRNNFPFADDGEYYDPNTKSEYPTQQEFEHGLNLVCEMTSKLYAWIVETDFDLIHRRVLARDEYLSKFKQRECPDASEDIRLRCELKFIQSKSKL